MLPHIGLSYAYHLCSEVNCLVYCDISDPLNCLFCGHLQEVDKQEYFKSCASLRVRVPQRPSGLAGMASNHRLSPLCG